MMEEMTIQVPLKNKHIKYLSVNGYLNGLTKVTKTDPVGAVLQGLLQPKSLHGEPVQIGGRVAMFELQLCSTSSLKIRMQISQGTVEYMHNQIEDLIDDEWCKLCDYGVRKGHRIKDVASDFVDKYKFTEKEMSMEKLRKCFYRWRLKTSKVYSKQVEALLVSELD